MRDAALALLEELVALPSLSGQEATAQARVADLMADAGLEVETFTVDTAEVRDHPAFSMEVDRPSLVGVIGRSGHANGGRTLLLDAHIDVVPVGDDTRWSYPPFKATEVDGCIYGRGTCDTKGGLAAAIAAAASLRDAGLSGQVAVASVVAEEDGGAGTLGLIHHGVTADGAVVIEPTRLQIGAAQAGALSFRVKVDGQSAHGCLREEGDSAIERWGSVQHALLALEARRNQRLHDPLFDHLNLPFAICVGRLEAGDWASSVADWLHAEGRYGIAPDEALAEARAELEDALKPHIVEWWGGRFLPARTDADHPLITALRNAAPEAGVEGVPYGSDMGLLVGVAGIPTAVFGPGDIRNAHRPDEYVDVADVVTAAETFVRLTQEWCR